MRSRRKTRGLLSAVLCAPLFLTACYVPPAEVSPRVWQKLEPALVDVAERSRLTDFRLSDDSYYGSDSVYIDFEQTLFQRARLEWRTTPLPSPIECSFPDLLAAGQREAERVDLEGARMVRFSVCGRYIEFDERDTMTATPEDPSDLLIPRDGTVSGRFHGCEAKLFLTEDVGDAGRVLSVELLVDAGTCTGEEWS